MTKSGKPLNWEKLEDDFKNERSVALFLGTGIDYGAPNGKDYSWDALLNHLLKYVIVQLLPSDNFETQVAGEMLSSAKKQINNLIQEINSQNKLFNVDCLLKLKEQVEFDLQFPRDVKSTIVKQTLGNEIYVKLIQDFLYGMIDKTDINEAGERYVEYLYDRDIKPGFFSLFSVADLILRNRNISAVVTQNYDQFLCDAILILQNNDNYNQWVIKHHQQVRKMIPNTICDWKGQTDFTYDHLNIYHVHGFIPRYDEIQAPTNNHIVLSLDEFYEDSRNVYSWQIASQLHLLSQYTCIFCGLSLQDYTSQRLLHYVKEKHRGNLYYFTASNGDAKGIIKDRIKNKFHEKNGLTVLYDEQGYNHIFQLLGELQYGEREKQEKTKHGY